MMRLYLIVRFVSNKFLVFFFSIYSLWENISAHKVKEQADSPAKQWPERPWKSVLDIIPAGKGPNNPEKAIHNNVGAQMIFEAGPTFCDIPQYGIFFLLHIKTFKG